MWTLVALFCNLTEPNKGACVPVVPPLIFQTYEQCTEFAIAETTSIALDKVSYDYQCVGWQNKI
jgi:hypothetical protein